MVETRRLLARGWCVPVRWKECLAIARPTEAVQLRMGIARTDKRKYRNKDENERRERMRVGKGGGIWRGGQNWPW